MFKALNNYINNFLHSFLLRKQRPYKTVYADELPESLEESVVYVIGEGNHLWYVALICPCGCGQLLQMSLYKEGKPRWKLYQHSDETISLYPSIWRKVGCCSHFFLENGKIRWVKEQI